MDSYPCRKRVRGYSHNIHAASKGVATPLDFLEPWEFRVHFCKNNIVFGNQMKTKKLPEKLYSMKVVNDIAERGVALIEEFNKLVTTDEDQKQFLLLVVKNYRQMYPDIKKSTLLA
ncbi:unnamed protein product [Euphydryas editha]|uniref:Uncharacterized protein n=1 Tax=Euphydryas editha TaxID=104508 RepID=A0AAU9UFH6_EUPED|nr:unnamed protein product [Euphydryas editha]